ncbi:MAG TPA: hypothetical protein VEZ55_04955 [Chitinophagaceae bacterium]|nr:hypothetical protein [Chitinophagaceae bacterium]
MSRVAAAEPRIVAGWADVYQASYMHRKPSPITHIQTNFDQRNTIRICYLKINNILLPAP